jgi:hypothetical protein
MTLDLRDLPPVEEPIDFPDRDPSQTFLRTHERCPRSAYLYRKHDGGPGAHALDRGTVVHLTIQRCTEYLIEQGERQLPPEVAQDILLDVFKAHPELVMPSTERNSARGMIFNWAEGSFFDPATILGVEVPLTLQVGDWTIGMRPDLAELVDPWTIHVTDYKTAFPPPKDEFEREELFQLQLYALGLRYGQAEGFPTPLGEGVTRFRLKEVYPRILREDGCARREIDITETELLNFRLDVEAQLDRLAGELRTQKWQAVPGEHCATCTSPAECPIPRHLRPDSRVAELDLAGAERLAAWHDRQSAATRDVMRQLKLWSKANGGREIIYGKDVGLVWWDQVSEEISDKAALRIAAESAAEFGTPFNLSDHVTMKTSTRFGRRKLNGRESDG